MLSQKGPPENRVPEWVIFDGSSRFWLLVDFRFAPKADLRQ
jgi:hypothetical protein